jgi:hypothetical protein
LISTWLVVFMHSKKPNSIPRIFFLEHTGELRIIILRRNGLEPVQPPPRYKLNFKLHEQSLETKKGDDLSIKTAILLGVGPSKR